MYMKCINYYISHSMKNIYICVNKQHEKKVQEKQLVELIQSKL